MKSVIRTDWSIAFFRKLQVLSNLGQCYLATEEFVEVEMVGDLVGWFGKNQGLVHHPSSKQNVRSIDESCVHKPTHGQKSAASSLGSPIFVLKTSFSLYCLHAKLDLKPFEMQGRKALLRGISGRGTVVGGIFGGWKLNFGWVVSPRIDAGIFERHMDKTS